MTLPHHRPPVLGRIVAALIVGHDSDALRGDLEERYQQRLDEEGDSIRVRAGFILDAAVTASHWWLHRARRSTPANVTNSGQTSGEVMRTIGPDLRQIWRGVLRRPGYAGMVALTLGLGIGATTTIYSVVDAMLVRPLPYREADRLVVIGNTTPGEEWLEGGEGVQRLGEIALPNFRDLRERAGGIQRAAAIERRNWLHASPETAPELLDVSNVEDGFFDLLSVAPILGRLPRAGDQAPPDGQWGAAISYDGWQRRFGGSPDVLGKRFGPFIVVGVLPRDFVQPAALVGRDVEFWLHLDPDDRRYSDRRRRGVKVLARLEPGLSVARVRRDLAAAQSSVAAEHPAGNALPDGRTLGSGVNSLRDATIGVGQRPALIFLGAALLLLVLAGTNAANLIIVRGLERDGELALRRALGASRARLAITLVFESVSLALAGGAIGLGIAVAGVDAIRRFGPQMLTRMGEIGVNFRIVIVGAVLSVVVGMIVGLIPAIRSSRVDLLSNLRASLTALSPRGTRVRTSLAATQLALALVLGIGASLLFRSYVHRLSERLGFEPDGLVAFTVAFKNDRPWATWDEVVEKVGTLPGVTAVAGASSLPFQTPAFSLRVAPADRARETSIAAVAGHAVSPTFFATAKIPVVRGRAFDSSDQPQSYRVAIVNERFARTTFGERNPIGQRLRMRDEGGDDPDIEIVGVVGDVVQARVEDGVQPAIYLPHTQAGSILNVLVATRRPPEQFEREIRRALVDVGLWSAPMLGYSTMRGRIGTSLSAPRFQLLLIGAFAAVAVLLAAIGLYGTLAFTVRSRTRELGIRMAMGATQRQIFELVLRQGVRVLAVGLTAGLIGALGLTRLLQGFLYRVSPVDPVAFAGALVVVVMAVLVAAVRPAGHAARVDPITSMRTEV
jgi:predicted permease